MASEDSEIIQAIFENADFSAFAVDGDGHCIFVDGKGLAALGGKQRFLGKHVDEIFGPDSPVTQAVRRALAGEAFTVRYVMFGQPLEARYAPLRGESGIRGVVGISVDITERVASEANAAAQSERLAQQGELLDLARDAILTRGLDGTITYWNRGAERMYGIPAATAIGSVSHALLHTEFPAALAELERALLADGFWEGELTHVRPDGQRLVVASRWALRRDATGAPLDVFEINTDITGRKAAEEAQSQRQAEIIRAQAHAIAEMSTPLIPIADGVLVMPLVGMMDSMRARQVMDSLLSGLVSARGRTAILDITGVPVVDTATANALIQAAKAARLLGAEVILTGIRPEVAQTLVAIDANLGSITTRGTLQSGIEFALGRRLGAG